MQIYVWLIVQPNGVFGVEESRLFSRETIELIWKDQQIKVLTS